MPELDLASRTLWRRGSIAHDGLRLAYASAGEGRVVVFLSGGPGDGPSYLMPLADCLTAPRWRRILLHQRGTGRSPVRPGTPLQVSAAVEDLALLALHLGVEQICLVGHGYGANLALLAAGWRPDLVDGVVAIGLGPLDAALADLSRRGAQSHLDPAGQAALQAAMTRRDKAVAGCDGMCGDGQVALRGAMAEMMSLLGPRYVRRAQARERWLRELAEELDHDPWTRRALLDSLGGVDQPSVVGQVRCPVQVIHGRHDLEPVENVQALQRLVPHAKVTVLDEAAHLPWLDQPDAVSATLHAALDSF